MALFFRAVQDDQGLWTCRQGLHEIDAHSELRDAIRHLRELATASAPAEVFLHFRDGSVRSLGVDQSDERPGSDEMSGAS